MRVVFELDPAEISPSRKAVLESQGVPHGEIAARIDRLLDDALELYRSEAAPRAVFEELDRSSFEDLYQGDGHNEERTPVEEIVPAAERLALFAVTLGQPVSDQIATRFETNDLALAAMLDSVASEAADRAVSEVARRFLRAVEGEAPSAKASTVLPYSPGYCGWHITGQRRLFAQLRPEEIGITLNSSCLMTPLKSVSGVLLVGHAAVHDFNPDFDFCDRCTTRGCESRVPIALED